jgi:deoxyribodipyrimidine photolyase-related protein
VLVLAAMRHFADALRDGGVAVDYIRLNDPENTQSLRGEVLRAAARHDSERIVATEPGEWRVRADMATWHDGAGCAVEIRDDDRFLCDSRAFRAWADGRRAPRMEFFYREMRRHHDVLMEDGAPVGGFWNFDRENRKRLPPRVLVPGIPRFEPDATTRAVMDLVRERFAGHFGDIGGFCLPVTARDAAIALDDFIAHRLPAFGDWQDAMKTDSPVLFHGLISTSLNLGLLEPLAVCRAAEAAFRAGAAPLNSVEGFIRQILGWREFVRGIYWRHMPDYGRMNALAANRNLPSFYWTGETRMHCLAQVIGQTRKEAYAHHIQRLMVTGNFALITGLHPDAVDEWYLIVYADAYEWVEMPNTRGMALFADGGIMGSKPYAASGAYISRMSDYCGACAYDARDAIGARACPFNFLYWDFIARHADRFRGNPRMAMPLRSLERMAPERLSAIRTRAAAFLDAMDRGDPV